ncbi:hypothetical protein [Sphingomonas sp. 10B4]|uniref:hypothetical protein n=1 Tax=Sphingomonas sp. 10B4 TaxID=3048575 RepID=UPI002AB49171|nr:hypothetical protein [Sphingomonas sp. 10B4]MDY7523163.1 hypothetical protein [Sphingomonas sp. 10B4]MEB0284553.1 hypothetical protein [Sphingomonas sp. 10B4]
MITGGLTSSQSTDGMRLPKSRIASLLAKSRLQPPLPLICSHTNREKRFIVTSVAPYPFGDDHRA